MIEEVWLFYLKYCETPTIMVLVENGYRLYLRKVNSIGDTLIFHWTIIVYGMNGIPSPPTHPQKATFSQKGIDFVVFGELFFDNETWWEEVFVFYPGTINLCFDQTWQGGKHSNSITKWSLASRCFFVFWALEETYYHPNNYLDKNSQFFSGCCKIYGIGCFLDFICIPMYVSLSNNPKKRLIFLLKPPPPKNKDH